MAVDVRIRIGGVPFGVGAPLLAGLDAEPGVALVQASPTKLVTMLRQNLLDAALVSSIEAFRQPGYQAAEQYCIASRGPARSVRAFLKPGISLAQVKTVGLDMGSETSATLLQILMARRWGCGPCTFTPIQPNTDLGQYPQDLILLIGDMGLQAEAGQHRILDLGEEWFMWTRLPFVFALWLMPAKANPTTILPLLQRARQTAMANGILDGTDGAIYYNLGAEEHRGLLRFAQEAVALHLADSHFQPTFCSHSPQQANP